MSSRAAVFVKFQTGGAVEQLQLQLQLGGLPAALGPVSPTALTRDEQQLLAASGRPLPAGPVLLSFTFGTTLRQLLRPGSVLLRVACLDVFDAAAAEERLLVTRVLLSKVANVEKERLRYDPYCFVSGDLPTMQVQMADASFTVDASGLPCVPAPRLKVEWAHRLREVGPVLRFRGDDLRLQARLQLSAHLQQQLQQLFGGRSAGPASQPKLDSFCAARPRGPAAEPPQPQHVTQYHHGSRGRRLLRRSGSLCGHRRRSLSTPAPLRAACSLALPPSTACSSPWEGSPSTMQLPPPSTQHPMVWCQSARGNGSQQASQHFCGQLLSANAAL